MWGETANLDYGIDSRFQSRARGVNREGLVLLFLLTEGLGAGKADAWIDNVLPPSSIRRPSRLTQSLDVPAR